MFNPVDVIAFVENVITRVLELVRFTRLNTVGLMGVVFVIERAAFECDIDNDVRRGTRRRPFGRGRWRGRERRW